MSSTTPHGHHTLRAPGNAHGLRDYALRTFRLWSFTVASARARLRASNSELFLGNLWLVLEPIVFIGTYYLIFGFLLKVQRGTDNFIAFLTVGQFIFSFSRRSIVSCANSLVGGAAIVSSLPVPRAVLPLSKVVEALLIQRFNLVVMLGAVWLSGEPPRLSWLVVVPLTALQLAHGFGFGMLLARVVFKIPDFNKLINASMRIILYGSGVFFPIDQYVARTSHGEVATLLLTLNPFYDFITIARWGVLGMEPLHPRAAVNVAVVSTTFFLIVGFWYFYRGERGYSGSRVQQLGRASARRAQRNKATK